MTAPRRRERLSREERREQLLDALLQLIAAEGFAAVSMEGIARAGAIAKTVVYDAFGDVDTALQALFAREQRRALEAIAAAIPRLPLAAEPQAILLDALTQILDDVRAHPDSWRLILLPADGTPPALRAAIEQHRRQLVDQTSPFLTWAVQHQELPDLDTELLGHTAVAAVEHAAQLTLMDPERFTPERFVTFVEALMGIATSRTRRRRTPAR